MRVLLDTNIVLDYLGANKGFTEDAEKVFDLAAKRKDMSVFRPGTFLMCPALTTIAFRSEVSRMLYSGFQ